LHRNVEFVSNLLTVSSGGPINCQLFRYGVSNFHPLSEQTVIEHDTRF